MHLKDIVSKKVCYENVEKQLRKQHPKGKITFKECYMCGYLAYSSTDPKGIDTYKIINMDKGQCPKCMELAQRTPEVYDWVLQVLAHTLRKDE
jgi:hypothetical protein